MDDHRIFARLSVKLSVKFLDQTTGKEGKGETLNICANGVCFATQEDLLPDTPLGIWFYIPDYHEPLYVQGKVVWAKAPDNSNQRHVGVFIETEDHHIMGLSRILRMREVG